MPLANTQIPFSLIGKQNKKQTQQGAGNPWADNALGRQMNAMQTGSFWNGYAAPEKQQDWSIGGQQAKENSNYGMPDWSNAFKNRQTDGYVDSNGNYQSAYYSYGNNEIEGGNSEGDSGFQFGGGDGISSALAVMNGLTNIAGTTFGMMQTADTSQQRNAIRDISNIGTSQYGNYGQMLTDYDRLSYTPSLRYEDIRGRSRGELAGDVFSNTLTGATTGLQVGGPWGALAGGIIGLGAGVGGVLAGNYNARQELRDLEANRYIASDRALQNLNAQLENYSDYNHRRNVAHRADMGGKIERKAPTLQQFADSVVKRQKAHDSTRSSGIMRQYCKGGLKVRIKR